MAFPAVANLADLICIYVVCAIMPLSLPHARLSAVTYATALVPITGCTDATSMNSTRI